MLSKGSDMALTKYKLGELIEEIDRRNDESYYDLSYVRGISNAKEITETKADVDETVIKKFYIIMPGEFIYNPRTTRMGEKVGLGYNNTDSPLLFTFNNIAFRIKTSAIELLLPEYLYIYYNRNEFDRYAMSRSWGSATELFTFEEMCDIEINLPSLSVQQKYVDIYKAMVANQQSYERGLEDLKLVCDGYIEDLRRKMPCKPIGEFIEQSKEKNTDGTITLEQGINIEKKFITPQRSNENFFGRQIVRTGQIAYCTQLNNANVAVALRTGPDCIVSSVYDVIYIKDHTKVLPEYLMMWLSRSEFGRYVYWASQGTSYEFLSYENLAGYRIPVPNINTQKDIVNIYAVYIQRKEINQQLKEKIKNICPILIKGSLEEGK